MKIGITGGAGFIGCNLARRLALAGHEVFIIDNLSTGFLDNLNETNHIFCNGDLTDWESVREFFSKTEPEYIFHLGALGSVPRSLENPRSSFENNALATLNVLEAARQSKTPILFSSSSSVYGKNVKLPKIETDWVAPISPYAASKLSAEALCQSFKESFNLRTSVFRLFNVYGPHQSAKSLYAAVIPKWIMAAKKGNPLEVFGDGEQKRDFTFVDDVTKVMEDVMNHVDEVIGPTNLAFGKPVTLNEILVVFREYFGDIEILYLPRRQGDIRDSESDPSKLLGLQIGPNEPTGIREGLLRTFEWFSKLS
jgi:UDP-glucose 4-epimerase